MTLDQALATEQGKPGEHFDATVSYRSSLTAGRAVNTAPVCARSPPHRDPDRARLIELRDAGASWRTIVSTLGISTGTARAVYHSGVQKPSAHETATDGAKQRLRAAQRYPHNLKPAWHDTLFADIFIHHQEDGQNMRIISVLFTIGVLSGAMAIRGQVDQPALQGLPQYGVTLTGTLENPVIENHSGRVVIGYDVRFSDANGRGMTQNQVMATSGLPAGIPDGGSVYVKGAAPVNPTVPMPSPVQVRVGGQGPIVTATLRSVIFADGQFAGVDEQGAFEQFVKKLKAINEVGILAKTQAWDQIETLAEAFAQGRQAPSGLAAPPTFVVAPPPGGEDHILITFRQLAAMRLAQVRKSKGEAAADQLAQSYSSLPLLWK